MKLTRGNWPAPFEYLLLAFLVAVGITAYVTGMKAAALGVFYLIILILCIVLVVNFWERITKHKDPDE